MAHAAQNRLAKEASAYLRQHANNPVDWFPWCEEALAKARREDKPILLSIGYSACHWCHVMERESFEDEAVAALLNAGFVSIKVDREERPDLDQIYQSVVQLLGRGGGWPLTVFLTPDQRPFFAGTYFPPVAKYGMPSFSDLLVSVRKAYDEQREDVALQAAEIAGALGRVSEVSRGKGEAWTPGPDLLAKATKKLFARFDDEHGGFGARPKFPNTMNVEVLLRRAASERDTDAEARVRRALDGMRQGGIWDHLGGGFHRYSTDEKWLVPHFEKMLYDNALLGRLYVDAGRALEASGYVGVARDIAAYLVRDMQSPAGALYATEDADSEGVEGKYFVWTPAEVDAAVADPLAREVVKAVFGITEQGNFEESHTNATVLSEVDETGRIAVRMGKPPSEIEAALATAKTAMLAARGQRVRPFRDEKRLACWNGLAIGALAEIGGATGDAELVAAAERAFEDVEINLVRKGRVERYFDGEGFVAKPGFLDDHANLANAALDLYEVTGKPRYVTIARDIADDVLARFAEPDGPGFYFTPSDGEPLLVRMKDPYDQAVPAGAAMTALLLLRLGTLVGGAYAERGARYLESVAASAVENPFGLGQTVSALDRLIRGSIDVVVVGGRDRPETAALVRAVLSRYVPNRTLAVVDPGNPTTLAAASALADGKPAGKDGMPVAYVCRDRACSPPVSDPAALIALLAP